MLTSRTLYGSTQARRKGGLRVQDARDDEKPTHQHLDGTDTQDNKSSLAHRRAIKNEIYAFAQEATADTYILDEKQGCIQASTIHYEISYSGEVYASPSDWYSVDDMLSAVIISDCNSTHATKKTYTAGRKSIWDTFDSYDDFPLTIQASLASASSVSKTRKAQRTIQSCRALCGPGRCRYDDCQLVSNKIINVKIHASWQARNLLADFTKLEWNKYSDGSKVKYNSTGQQRDMSSDVAILDNGNRIDKNVRFVPHAIKKLDGTVRLSDILTTYFD